MNVALVPIRGPQEDHQWLRGRGHSHGRALRGVVGLLTVLMAILGDQTTYDPARRRAVPAQAH